jgi:Rps23 Pro-64 3,4-dihydroxylase Tpa1-like proline 4-hydroxylase
MKHIRSTNFTSVDEYFKKFSTNTPFPHLIIDNFLKENSANNVLDNFRINKKWTNLSLVNNYKKFLLNDREYMNIICNEIIEELGSKEFIEYLISFTGFKNIFLDKELVGGGLQQTLNAGSLNLHTDFTSHITNKNWRRVLNLIIYFNKNWLDEYNGNIEFWDYNTTTKVKSYSPTFNKCVIFKTDQKSLHGFPDSLNLPANMSRKSLAVYYFTKEEKPIKLYPSTFTPRPTDKFYYKFLMGIDSFLNKIFSILKRYHIVNDKFASKILDLFKSK